MRAEFKTLRAEIQAVRTELKGEIQAVRAEVHQMDKRLEQVWALLMIVIAGIMRLIGFVIWDRKTAMRPVDQEVQLLKQELDAQRRDAEGFSLTAVVRVLREAAQGSPPIGQRAQERLAPVAQGFLPSPSVSSPPLNSRGASAFYFRKFFPLKRARIQLVSATPYGSETIGFSASTTSRPSISRKLSGATVRVFEARWRSSLRLGRGPSSVPKKMTLPYLGWVLTCMA